MARVRFFKSEKAGNRDGLRHQYLMVIRLADLLEGRETDAPALSHLKETKLSSEEIEAVMQPEISPKQLSQLYRQLTNGLTKMVIEGVGADGNGNIHYSLKNPRLSAESAIEVTSNQSGKIITVKIDEFPIYCTRQEQERKVGALKASIVLTYSCKQKADRIHLLKIAMDNIHIYNILCGNRLIQQEDLIDASDEEERLSDAIKKLREPDGALARKARALLALVHQFKIGNANQALLQELDEALSSTRELISLSEFSRSDESSFDTKEEKINKLMEIGHQFQKSARLNVLGAAIIGLVTAAVISLCVAAVVMSFGGALFPIMVLSLVAMAGGTSMYGFFSHAHDQKQVSVALNEVKEAAGYQASAALN